MLNYEVAGKIRSSFLDGTLRVQSVAPDGSVSWLRVLEATRADTSGERICKVTTSVGSSVMTGGHRVFVSPTVKVEAESLTTGQRVLGIPDVTVVSVVSVLPRKWMYDLTVDKWHNFKLERSGMVVSNSPDRNYHFRPPTHEGTVNQFNRVFGYVWEDYELYEFLERSLDMIAAAPPRTPFNSLDDLVQQRREWRTLLLVGAMQYALFALMINWTADEFSVAGDTEVTVTLPDGEEVALPVEYLYRICKHPCSSPRDNSA